MTGNDDTGLSWSREKELEKDALEGSCYAAMRLYAFFEIYKSNEEEGRYWLQIAAENGDPNAQRGLSIFMERGPTNQQNAKSKQSQRDKVRAAFWDKKSVENMQLGVGTPPCPQDRAK